MPHLSHLVLLHHVLCDVANGVQGGLQVVSGGEERGGLLLRQPLCEALFAQSSCSLLPTSGGGVAVHVAAHAEKLGQAVQEDASHPRRHAVMRG